MNIASTYRFVTSIQHAYLSHGCIRVWDIRIVIATAIHCKNEVYIRTTLIGVTYDIVGDYSHYD